MPPTGARLSSWVARGALAALLVTALEIALLLLVVPVVGSNAGGFLCLVHAIFGTHALVLLPMCGLAAVLEERVRMPRLDLAALVSAGAAIAAAQTAVWALHGTARRYPEFPERVGVILQAAIFGVLLLVGLAARYLLYPVLERRLAAVDPGATLVRLLLLVGCVAGLGLAYVAFGPIMLAGLAALASVGSAACALGAVAGRSLSHRRANLVSAVFLGALVLTPLSCRHRHARFLLYNHSLAAGPIASVARDVADLDGDGSLTTWLGGADCAELDRGRGPEVSELPGDGVDQDCRGGDAPRADAVPERALPGWTCARPPEPLSLVLVTLDAVGADALSAAVTPNLDRLQKESVTFTRAYAGATSTTESLTAFFAGRSLSAMMTPGGGDVVVPEGLLPARLTRRGYHAHAVDALDLPEQLRQGFGDMSRWWRDATPGSGKERFESAVTTNAALDVAAGAERPFFLWVHYFDAHAPYLQLEYRGPASTPYLREVAYVDVHVGRLLAGLAQMERTALMVTADHGEERARRGIEGHGPLLYETSIRVPLIVRIPGCAPARIDQPVALPDLGAAIERLIGAAPAAALAEPPAVAVTEAISATAFARSIVAGRYKLVDDVKNGGRMLFDLETDPEETTDVRAALPTEESHLDALYQEWLDRAGQLAAQR